MRSSQGLTFASMLMASVGTAAADSDLDWRAPPECPSAEQAQAHIARLAPLSARASSRTRVVITRLSPAQLEARVAVGSGAAAREHVLHDHSCEALTRAAALVIALALDSATAPTPVRSRTSPAARATGLEVAGAAIVGTAQTSRDGAGSPQPGAFPDASPAQPDLPPTAAEPLRADRADLPQARPQSASRPAALPKPAPEAGTRSAGSPRSQTTAAPRVQAHSEPAPQSSHHHDVLLRDVLPSPRGVAPQQRPEPAGSAPAGTASDRVQPAPDVLSDGPSRRLGVRLGVGAGLSAGMVPRLGAGISGGLSMLWGPWSSTLRLGFIPAQTATLGGASFQGGEVALAHASLAAGVHLRAGALEVPLLAGIESGFFLVRGLGVPERDSAAKDWLAASLSTGVSYALSQRLRLLARLQGLAALRRPRFALQLGAEPSVFFRPNRLGARLDLGLEVVLQ